VRDPPPTEAMLERRLRQLYGSLDTRPDFGPRLAARLASMRAVPDERARAQRRAAAEAERREVEAALRRRLWRRLLLAAALAAGGIVFVQRVGAGAARLLEAHLGHADPATIALASLAAFGAGLWYLAQQALRGPPPGSRLG
jgi:hypothetical protein